MHTAVINYIACVPASRAETWCFSNSLEFSLISRRVVGNRKILLRHVFQHFKLSPVHCLVPFLNSCIALCLSAVVLRSNNAIRRRTAIAQVSPIQKTKSKLFFLRSRNVCMRMHNARTNLYWVFENMSHH